MQKSIERALLSRDGDEHYQTENKKSWNKYVVAIMVGGFASALALAASGSSDVGIVSSQRLQNNILIENSSSINLHSLSIAQTKSGELFQNQIISLSKTVGDKGKPSDSAVTKMGKVYNSGPVFMGFIGGLFLIGFALPMVWMNERREVHQGKLIKAANDAVVPNVDTSKDLSETEWKLVHCNGDLTTEKPVEDDMFGVSIDNSVKIKRIVETLQWVQEETLVKAPRRWFGLRSRDTDLDTTIYRTYQSWETKRIDDEKFGENDENWDNGGLSNPGFGCLGEEIAKNPEISSDRVKIGQCILSSSQIGQLTAFTDYEPKGEAVDKIVQTFSERKNQNKYGQLTKQGSSWFYMHPITSVERDENHVYENGQSTGVIGDVRIMWKYVECSPVTIMAQQVKSKTGETTFRKWNPKMLQEEDNTPEVVVTCKPVFCCCWLVEKLFKTGFEETVDQIDPDTQSVEELIKYMNQQNQGTACMFRWVSWIMSVVGHWLLFSPIIELLKWIPLVGKLTASVLSVAAAIFAFLWGTMLHLLVMSLACIVHKPLYGVKLMVGVAIILLIMCVIGEGDEEKAAAASTAAGAAGTAVSDAITSGTNTPASDSNKVDSGVDTPPQGNVLPQLIARNVAKQKFE